MIPTSALPHRPGQRPKIPSTPIGNPTTETSPELEGHKTAAPFQEELATFWSFVAQGQRSKTRAASRSYNVRLCNKPAELEDHPQKTTLLHLLNANLLLRRKVLCILQPEGIDDSESNAPLNTAAIHVFLHRCARRQHDPRHGGRRRGMHAVRIAVSCPPTFVLITDFGSSTPCNIFWGDTGEPPPRSGGRDARSDHALMSLLWIASANPLASLPPGPPSVSSHSSCDDRPSFTCCALAERVAPDCSRHSCCVDHSGDQPRKLSDVRIVLSLLLSPPPIVRRR